MSQNGSTTTVMASAARTATENSDDQGNVTGRGVHVAINVTAVTATPSVTFTIQGKDTVNGAYYDILTSAAITATGTTYLSVYPGITAAANVSASDILPRVWRVRAVHADADSITYSVAANLVI